MKNTEKPCVEVNHTAMPLEMAMLCMSCETVYHRESHTRCPACEGEVAIPFQRFSLSLKHMPAVTRVKRRAA